MNLNISELYFYIFIFNGMKINPFDRYKCVVRKKIIGMAPTVFPRQQTALAMWLCVNKTSQLFQLLERSHKGSLCPKEENIFGRISLRKLNRKKQIQSLDKIVNL